MIFVLNYFGADPAVFVNSMIRSNVAICICHSLEVEGGEKYRVTFLGERRIVSAGWQKFSTAKLLVGDRLVFHLVRPLKFKVYIMGRHGLPDVDAAFSLLKMKSCAKKEVFETFSKATFKSTNPELVDNQSEGNNEDFGSTLAEITFRGPAADFGDVRMIDNFVILVNGVTKYSQLAVQVRTIYYDLCFSEGSFLHENLLKSIDSNLAAEIISETTNIANAIRACKLPPSHADCVMWEKTLHASELLDFYV
ncbi:B3 domain-containing protein [Pyrus ussuriensis x Pyrus communis]|uniref:B3 domain-containing protein n=1 Tax=Pyrus ussuriensis x Pyrus communis TaxID=2448454 RepID=A0A5N5I9N2_9ROSA|nr:B3 domain-containing protein [Pyrus ussuriensis x Pyrus communis]